MNETNGKYPYEKIFGSNNGQRFKGNKLNDYHESDLNEDSEDGRDRDTSLMLDLEESDEMTVGECCLWFRQRYFTHEKLRRRLPFLSWLPNYSLADLKGDVIAGLSVAFTIVPQGLALAVLAGLPAQYGLYTSFMGCFVYAFLGS
ncbi:unnamed protein product, partial [Medioppia subpectinata]